MSDDQSFTEQTRRFQRALVERALRESRWNVAEAARRLEISRSYLNRLIKLHGLVRDTRPESKGRRAPPR